MEESEKEKVFLQRQWELLEGNKKLRSQIPFVCCTLIIGISAFFLNKKDLSCIWYKSPPIVVVAILGILGFLALLVVNLQYNYTNKKIIKLYDDFKIDFIKDLNQKWFENGYLLFGVGYLAIIIFSFAAIVLFIWMKNGG